jgi:hypothetical protein
MRGSVRSTCIMIEKSMLEYPRHKRESCVVRLIRHSQGARTRWWTWRASDARRRAWPFRRRWRRRVGTATRPTRSRAGRGRPPTPLRRSWRHRNGGALRQSRADDAAGEHHEGQEQQNGAVVLELQNVAVIQHGEHNREQREHGSQDVESLD